MAELLLAHGAQLKAKGKEGMTALEIARSKNLTEMIALLENPAGSRKDQEPRKGFLRRFRLSRLLSPGSPQPR